MTTYTTVCWRNVGLTEDDKIEVLKKYGYLTIEGGLRHCSTYLRRTPSDLVPLMRGSDINSGLAIDTLYGKLYSIMLKTVDGRK